MFKFFNRENKILEIKPPSMKAKIMYVLAVIILFFAVGYFFFLSAPSNFKPGTVFQIEPGMTLRNISLKLQEENIIRSRLAFEAFVILFGGDKHIRYSNYLFEKKMSAYEVAEWIVKGERYRAAVIVTIPEGFNINEIAEVYGSKLINFNKDNFFVKAKEGHLFPDTYYFFSSATELDAIDSMSKNFEKKITPIRPEIVSSGRTEEEIIIMASIIEKEAKGDNDRALISGILWKRLQNGMRLQVDAAPDTYKIKGLPKNPISNPGIKAINAAIYPQTSTYVYYIHGKDGNTYYAKTFEEHKKNIAKYLKLAP